MAWRSQPNSLPVVNHNNMAHTRILCIHFPSNRRPMPLLRNLPPLLEYPAAVLIRLFFATLVQFSYNSLNMVKQLTLDFNPVKFSSYIQKLMLYGKYYPDGKLCRLSVQHHCRTVSYVGYPPGTVYLINLKVK